jgi:voltage-gated potassium channel Kch
VAHRAALATIAAAAALDTAGGLAFAAAEHIPAADGLYWAVITATTIGYGDITPRTPAGHVLAVLVALTVVPLFAAAFSLFTSGLTSSHVKRSEERVKRHLEDRLAEHHRALADANAARKLQRPKGSAP